MKVIHGISNREEYHPQVIEEPKFGEQQRYCATMTEELNSAVANNNATDVK
jgi:hypothetical protein